MWKPTTTSLNFDYENLLFPKNVKIPETLHHPENIRKKSSKKRVQPTNLQLAQNICVKNDNYKNVWLRENEWECKNIWKCTYVCLNIYAVIYYPLKLSDYYSKNYKNTLLTLTNTTKWNYKTSHCLS